MGDDDDHGMVQVLFLSEYLDELDKWLDSHGLRRFRIYPDRGDGMPAYGLAPKAWPQAVGHE